MKFKKKTARNYGDGPIFFKKSLTLLQFGPCGIWRGPGAGRGR